MIHPDTELRKIDDTIGRGVYAVKRIPKGSITWALDYLDHVLDPIRARELPKVYQPIIDRYAFFDAQGRHILCWDHGRYVNHSCDATSLPIGSICEIAIRDIYPGEQLTSDYMTLNLTKTLTCACGSSRCRREMRPTDLPQYIGTIDQVIREIIPVLSQVPQPVLPFMIESDRLRFEAVAGLHMAPPSCVEVIGAR